MDNVTNFKVREVFVWSLMAMSLQISASSLDDWTTIWSWCSSYITFLFTLRIKITHFCLNIFYTTKGITIHSFNKRKPMCYLLNIDSYHWNVIVVWAAILWFFLYTMIIATCRATKTSIVSNTGFLSLVCL